jgi:hypothetical protein
VDHVGPEVRQRPVETMVGQPDPERAVPGQSARPDPDDRDAFVLAQPGTGSDDEHVVTSFGQATHDMTDRVGHAVDLRQEGPVTIATRRRVRVGVMPPRSRGTVNST